MVKTACATIHLAIAKKYLEIHKELIYERVIAGTLYPDAISNNDVSDYTDINRGSDNISHVRGKVNLYAFLKEHERLNDFELGWFLHLVTDYLFFEECFSEEYLLNNSYEDFCIYQCQRIYEDHVKPNKDIIFGNKDFQLDLNKHCK